MRRRRGAFPAKSALLIGAVALGAVVVALVLTQIGRPPAPPRPGENFGPEASLPRGITAEGLHYLGSADAPLTITLFEDMGCPSCRALWAETEPQLVEEYIQTGRVRLVIYTVAIVNAQSLPAAEALACAADQGSYWEYREVLFANQGVVGFNRPNLVQLAEQIGLDTGEFAACYDQARHQNEILNRSEAAFRFGIQATPTIEIAGTRYQGVIPFDRDDPDQPGMQQILDRALDQAGS